MSAICKECGDFVENVEARPFPGVGIIRSYVVTMPCEHSSGFDGELPEDAWGNHD